jgi:hypothetical protein
MNVIGVVDMVVIMGEDIIMVIEKVKTKGLDVHENTDRAMVIVRFMG